MATGKESSVVPGRVFTRQDHMDVSPLSLFHKDSSRDSGAGSIEDNSYEYEQCSSAHTSFSDSGTIDIECEVVNATTQQTIICNVLHRDIRKKKKFKSIPPGTCILLHIRCSQPSFVYIFNKGSSGKTNLLIPNEDETVNFIPAGKTFAFPPPDADYDFEMDENCGTEIIEVFAFSERVPFGGETTPHNLQECFRDIVIKKKESGAVSVKGKGFIELEFIVQKDDKGGP